MHELHNVLRNKTKINVMIIAGYINHKAIKFDNYGGCRHKCMRLFLLINTL